MKKVSTVAVSSLVLALGIGVFASQTQSAATRTQTSRAAGATTTQQPIAKPAIAVAHAPASVTESQSALVKQYCATCHNDRNKNNAGGLSLQGFDASKVGHDEAVADVAE